MLSTEKPSSSDPSCSLRASSSSSDERASQKLALPEPASGPEVDLLSKSPLDQTPLPKFSIRDYVFTARSKDIKTNWPFSLKNLQLCLKHGVKEVLPPFQPSDAVRNLSSNRCTVKTSKENQSTGNYIKEAIGISDLVSPDSLDNTQADHVVLCNSAGKNDLPSTTACVSRQEIESIPNNKQYSSSSVETDSQLGAPVEAAATNRPLSNNTENSTRAPNKKSRLIVKFGAKPDRKLTEDIGSSSVSISETMGSKVCPVCKTFSSSSNTTLNAHIDQCLSKESTPIWAVDSKLSRHRIKPRKTKLMVDIYVTAKRCTLEELDKRNGTNWAGISKVSAEFTEKSVEKKKLGASPVHHEDTRTVGAVYIDANGTKLRILSKSNDALPVRKVGGDLGLRKPLKGGKGSKFLSSKKKKWHIQKQHKYLKLAPQTKNIPSNFNQKSQDEERNSSAEGSCWEDHQAASSKLKQPDELGTLGKWVRSKRTGLAHKINRKRGQEHACKLHVAQKLPVEGDQSCVTGLSIRNCGKKYSSLSGKPINASVNGADVGHPLKETRENDRKEQSPGLKRVQKISSFSARQSNGTIHPLPPSKRKGSQFIEECSSVSESHTLKSPDLTSGRKRVGSFAGPTNDSMIPLGPRSKVIRNCQSSLMLDAGASSTLNKKSSSTTNFPSSFKSISKSIKKSWVLKKSRERSMEDKNEAVAWNSETDEPYNSKSGSLENDSVRKRTMNKTCPGRSNVEESGKEGAVGTSWREEATMSRSPVTEYRCHDGNKCIDSSAGGIDRLQSNFDDPESPINEFRSRRNEIVAGPSSQLDFVFSKALGCEYHRLNSQSNSVRSFENYEGSFSEVELQRDTTELRLDGDMFYADNVVSDIGGQNVHVEEDPDSGVGFGNSFPEVDPIPIPGPPGSFLPSPRGMDLEDFQGNSSLTASRVQSPQEHCDLVDGGSSDSPISTTSTVSNPVAGGSGLKCSDDTLKSPVFISGYEKANPEFSVVGADISSENVAAVPMTMAMETQIMETSGESLKIHKIHSEKGTLGYKNEDQPCCCQRKERISQNLALNYHESPLLKRRAMSSLVVPALERNFDFNPDSRQSYMGSVPMMLPPNSFSSSGLEKMSSSCKNAPTDASSMKGSPDVGMKFSGHCDSDSASQSPSNPVLRLMGKNLMVVNKGEDTPRSQVHSKPCGKSNHLAFQYPVHPGVSLSNYQPQDQNYFHHMASQDSVISRQDPHGRVERGFDFRLASSFGGQTNLSKLEAPGLSCGMFPNQYTNGSFGASRDSYGYKGQYAIPSQQDQYERRLHIASRLAADTGFTGSDCNLRHPDSVAKPMKEIIIIDELPETEAKLATNVLRNAENLRDSHHAVSSGILLPATHYDLRKTNLIPKNQLQDPSLLGHPPMAQGIGFNGISTRQDTRSPVRWNCTPEGSGVLHMSPFAATPSSTGHLRPALYYSPR